MTNGIDPTNETINSTDARSRLENDVAIVGKAWEQSRYYERAERWTFVFWSPQSIFRKMFNKLDLTYVVELACGHGRHSEQIVASANHIAMIDIFETNLEVCKKRLGRNPNITFLKGDGSTFRPLEASSVTAIFCYDAMVHFSPAMVRSYLIDAARILKPGGRVLLHHSNYSAPRDRHYGLNPHARNHMTRPLFSSYAEEAGLELLEAKVFSWGKIPNLDCCSLLQRPKDC